MNAEKYSAEKEKLHLLLKDMRKYKREIDKGYDHLTNLKRALDIKINEHEKKGEPTGHIANKSLTEDIEAHSDGTFRLSHSYEP
jgi:type IV secretory pathway TrbF-like protein